MRERMRVRTEKDEDCHTGRSIREIMPAVCSDICMNPRTLRWLANVAASAELTTGLAEVLRFVEPARGRVADSDEQTRDAYARVLLAVVKNGVSDAEIIGRVFRNNFADTRVVLTRVEFQLLTTIRGMGRMDAETRAKVNRYLATSEDSKVAEYEARNREQAEFPEIGLSLAYRSLRR